MHSAARSARVHSGVVSPRIEIRSPGSMPSASRPLALVLTCSPSSAYEISIHSPSRWNFSAGPSCSWAAPSSMSAIVRDSTLRSVAVVAVATTLSFSRSLAHQPSHNPVRSSASPAKGLRSGRGTWAGPALPDRPSDRGGGGDPGRDHRAGIVLYVLEANPHNGIVAFIH